MHNAIQSVLKVRRPCRLTAWGLAALLLLVPVLAASAQAGEFTQRIFETLIELPDEHLALLVDLTSVLNESEDEIGLFMEAPRAFLLDEGIDLPPDKFQITGVNFMLPSAVEDEPWFGIAEPLEGFVFEPKGIGVFYRSIAIFIQEAFEAVQERIALEPTDHQTDMLRFMSDRFPGDTLDTLREVMRELDAMNVDDPLRLEFLVNPREYLIGRNLTLPAYSYRIIAIDMTRAQAAGSVVPGEIRAGLAVVPEGFGVFYNNLGVFLQRAI
ncbi:hypothetical protein IH601_10035 [Candidatus Bipolaricaulota bacterium]|nr:hypothetical protein [Candidatus Bipolaricaulota bacterium]TFH09698.1 MAG: hypothetical protein E4H08_05235 [Candidatus Atribacteria bacterium]